MPEENEGTPLQLTPEATVLLPGSDVPVPVSKLMSADVHSAKVQQVHAGYSEAKALADLLSTPEGAERLTIELAQQGYGKTFFQPGDNYGDDGDDDQMSDNQGSATPPPAAGIPAEITALLKQQSEQIAALTQAFVTREANTKIEQEIAAVQAKDPNVDPAVLMQIAAEKSKGFTLSDAFEMQRAKTSDARIAELQKELDDLRIAQFSNLDLGTGSPTGNVHPADRRVSTKADSDALIEQLIQEQAAKMAANR